jgi:hypothetical protein
VLEGGCGREGDAVALLACGSSRIAPTRLLAERARNGTTGPEPVPHPDDVIIDYNTGEVRIDGPFTEEQKETQNQLRAIGPDFEQSLQQEGKRLSVYQDSGPNRK